MKRYQLFKKSPSMQKQILEGFAYGNLKSAMRAADQLRRACPTYEILIYDNQAKTFLK